MLVDGPHADGAAAGERDARDTGPREQRAQDEHGRAHGRDELVGRLVARDARHAHPGDAVGVSRNLAPEALEERAGGHDVGRAGTLSSTTGSDVRSARTARAGPHSWPRSPALPREAAPAFDDQPRAISSASRERGAGSRPLPPI